MNAPRIDVHICHSHDEVARHLLALEGSRARAIHTRPGETIGEALHRGLAPAALRGGAVGGVVVGLATALVTLLLGGDLAAAAGIGTAVALTGGPFLGSLAGFSSALHLAERVGTVLGPDTELRGAHLVLAWPSHRP